jgi:hypothetical protein
MTSDAGVPRGIPASGAGAVVDLLSADPPEPVFRSVASDLIDQALAAPRRHVTRQEQWIEEPGTLHGGHWELLKDVV